MENDTSKPLSPKEMGTNGGELVRAEFPLPVQFLGKWICSSYLSMVYASAGTGKTFFSLGLAYAVAAGNSSFLGWRSKNPHRVIYFDSEMGKRNIQERFIKICESNEQDADDESIKFLTYEDCPRQSMWNLADEHDQRKYTEAAEGYDLIIIDNIAGCVRPCKRGESEFDTWPRVQDWLVKMRAANKSVLLIHHAGKNGTQRGPSTRVDALDFCIELRKPENHHQELGLKFELRFEKSRHFIGDEARPLEVTLTDFDQERLRWIHDPLIEARQSRKRTEDDLFEG